ncbi:MAG: 2-oxoglutarate dehydrogenase E1 component [Gemmatimonadota bacterium]|nr:2-oxoglutarate dehydrogenase E1 component [Gemmatimonadota bacterium]
MDDTLFDSFNAAYAQAMYEQFARNPDAVPAEWRRLFADGGSQAIAEGLFLPDQLNGHRAAPPEASTVPAPTAPEEEISDESAEMLRRSLPAISRATALVQAFRDHGHQLARIDPLGTEPPGHPQLSPAFFGTSMEELAEVPASFILDNLENAGEGASVADALQQLSEIYAGSIGYEFEHLDDHKKVSWLWTQVEGGTHTPSLSAQEKKELLRRLTQVEGLEQFIHKAYLGQKRFSLEGNDTLIPMLDLAIHMSARGGGSEVVIGAAHRGRLNVLTHTVGVSYGELLAEFEGPSYKGGQLDIGGTGDVKYHHGGRGKRVFSQGESIDVSLAPNPSHLEFVNPVVMGMARARQLDGPSKSLKPDTQSVLPILMHGDAAFAAEGVVAETLNMARLEGYNVGGTIHVIVNNQVGFTTDPKDGRSTHYASDLAKGYGIPVVHVNADDPEACLAAMRLAMAYRSEFGDDFVIDLLGYRRYGHNEGDEPAYTQPILYRKIAEHPTVRALYTERLVGEDVLTEDDASAYQDEVSEVLRTAQDHVREELASGNGAEGEPEIEPDDPHPEVEPESTAVAFDVLAHINETSLTVPEGFKPHDKLWRQLSRRAKDFSPERSLDWGHAESLAFGSLLIDEIPVRLTGQDAERGTFSHRHLVLHDSETGQEILPLQAVADARLEVFNSPLTETAVIGFEYGYSVGADEDVVLWEAQFGDFVNVAQVMIDQFLSSGLTKWGQHSRLMLLLPHGHEGQGPEHSSARLERFLQLCAEGNMRVTYPTTPAQYFHMLRRQAFRRPERPMIVMTPKSLLRHPMATSTVQDLTEGGFQPVLRDPNEPDPDKVTRLVLCTGKIYYDIAGHDRRSEAEEVAIARMELLYPFPAEALEALLGSYPNLREVVWTQEEPRNMGALTYVGPRLRPVVPREVALSYTARPERASPAEGKSRDHVKQQNRLVLEALGLEGASEES